MKARSILTTVLISLASTGLLAAPPSKSGEAEPYQARFSLLFENGDIGTAVQTSLEDAVPAGMRLMVRNVNQGFSLPSGQTGSCQLVGMDGSGLYYLPTPHAWSSNGAGAQLGQTNSLTEFHIDEGDFILGCYRSGGSGLVSVVITVTGELVDAY
jgi:hypothetical protein